MNSITSPRRYSIRFHRRRLSYFGNGCFTNIQLRKTRIAAVVAPLRLAGQLPSCATTSFGIWLNEEPKKPATKSDGYRSRIRSLNGFHGCSREGSIRLGETRGSQQHRVNYSNSRQTGTNVWYKMVISCSTLCAM